ncbi:MAG TPA: hypothetical protein VEU33_12570 [Archangium sp.]|nr:hypothetical protein [Archangium sp.]
MPTKPTRSARQKTSKSPTPAAARKPGPSAATPLEVDPFTPGREHPEWVKKNFPSYVEHQHENLVRSERVLEHQGSTITITTMYEVRLEGRLLTLHMMVDEEGRLWSHLCPYLTFATATELVLHLLERMPHLFEPAQPGPPGDETRRDHSGHGGHDHSAHGHGGGR